MKRWLLSFLYSGKELCNKSSHIWMGSYSKNYGMYVRFCMECARKETINGTEITWKPKGEE